MHYGSDGWMNGNVSRMTMEFLGARSGTHETILEMPFRVQSLKKLGLHMRFHSGM